MLSTPAISQNRILFHLLLAAGSVIGAAGGQARPFRGADGPVRDIDEVVFAVRVPGSDPHWYANFGYWSSDIHKKLYGPGGGKLCKLDLHTGAVTVLVDEPRGSVRDLHVHYDARTILFSLRRGGSHYYNLYEVQADGTRLNQITRGPYDDIEPTYLPCGDIVFCSSRCKRWVGCWHTQAAVLHRAARDGRAIRSISSNNEHDNTPAVLPDGRLLYTRWEYIDRNQVTFHHLWTLNPDGTGQMTYFGNMHPGTVMIDAKPIPGTDRVVAIFSPGHGRTEHAGFLTIVDPGAGPDEQRRAVRVRGCPGNVRDPVPLSDHTFLVARGRDLVLVDSAAGRHTVLYSLPRNGHARHLQIHEPWPLRPRRRERIIPDRIDWTQPTGHLVLQDVTHGRNMTGVKPGEISKLLVLEPLPKPVNFSGGPDLLSHLGTFSLTRAVGTVPIEADGSAYFQLPANRPFFFVALDERNLSVKRMQSFVSVMPGETTSCVGCHEQRTRTPSLRARQVLEALRRPPRRITPIADIPDVIDFTRHIQPILDMHCVRCHTFENREGGVILAGDQGLKFSHSYWNLLARRQIADGRNAYGNRPPRAIGSSASPLMQKIDGSHYDVKLSDRQWKTVWLWIETGAVYAGTYAALGSENGPSAAPFHATVGILNRRCAGCHTIGASRAAQGKIPLPAAPQHGKHYQRIVLPDDPIARLSIHILLNFTRPEYSPLLLGPLAKEAGGYGTCTPPVFIDTTDPDFQTILSGIRTAQKNLANRKRFHTAGFKPNEHYLREMKRFGVLPPSVDPQRDPLDVFAVDQAYWRSLWYKPTAAGPLD